MLDHTQQKIIAPTAKGGVSVANCIPRVIGETEIGYAFMFENKISKKWFVLFCLTFNFIFWLIFYFQKGSETLQAVGF